MVSVLVDVVRVGSFGRGRLRCPVLGLGPQPLVSGGILFVRRLWALLVAVLLSTLVLGLLAPGASAVSSSYEEHTLPGLGFTGHSGSAATDINDRGVAVGYTEAYSDACCSGYWHAVVWRGDAITDLGTLSGEHGSESAATGINKRNVVVGWSRAVGAEPVAVRWSLHGAGRPLWRGGEALDVNDHGLVVGTEGDRAVQWQNGRRRALPGLGGRTVPTAVNNHGLISGWSETSAGEPHAVVWRKGRLTDLGAGRALDVNDRGVVAGSTPSDGAVVWRDLRVQPLGVAGVAQAVSNSGVVAGTMTSDDYPFEQVFVWDGGAPTTIGQSVAAVVEAVNSRGVVAGAIGFYLRATLWTP